MPMPTTAPAGECCEEWMLTLEPRQRRLGEYVEVHQCPICKRNGRVTFKGVMLGDELDCGPIALD